MASGVELDYSTRVGDAKKRVSNGGWRTSFHHPLFVPEKFRTPIPSAWFTVDLTKAVDGSNRPWNDLKQQEIDDTMKPFGKLDRNGGTWEKLIWKRVEEKLQSAPQSCATFGKAGGFTWEIESIHVVYDPQKFDEFENITLKHDCEMGLYFHGTRIQQMRSIVQDGVRIPGANADMWFGNGAYFTNCLPYAQHYIGKEERMGQQYARGLDKDKGFRLPAVNNVVYVLGFHLKSGNTMVIPPDETPKNSGYKSKYRNRDGVEPGFDSHLAAVTPSGGGNFGFRPCQQDNTQKGDQIEEWAIFDPKRACLKYVIGLKRTA